MSTRRYRTKGFTLLEVLIATAVTLLMMISLAKIFDIIGTSMKQGRAALELNNDLRDVALRIQADLSNATATVSPPSDPARAQGYFKAYDGPFTDYTAPSFSNFLNTDADPLNDIEDLSRFGDTDDVLMFTARSDDIPFTGEVPLYVLLGINPVTDSSAAGYDPAVFEPVTISARYAEIIVFAEPIVTSLGNPDLDPAPMLVDPNAYQTITGSDMPAGYRLYYRTLLVRPDLNLPNGELPSAVGSTDHQAQLLAMATQIDPGTGPVSLPSPTCDMALPHTQCDLSIRRVTPQDLPATTVSTVAANSLEDLVDPANRFAHYQYELSGDIWSMPIMALGPKVDIPFMANEPGSTGIPTGPGGCQSGFLHPAFSLYANRRLGEDVLADHVLAFDVQAYDPGAPFIGSPGIDGVAGSIGDDNGNGSTDEGLELGWEGSDDVILSPGDAGYLSSIVAVRTGTPGVQLAGVGAYTDIGWGWKMRNHILPANLQVGDVGVGELTGLDAPFDDYPFTTELYQSGQAFQAVPLSNGPPTILQHAFDSWTNQYESDGIYQGAFGGSAGVAMYGTAPGGVIVDRASNGLDDVGTALGIDDPSERETLPPYAMNLRGIRVTIRMEEPTTGQFRQASVAKEFVTTQ